MNAIVPISNDSERVTKTRTQAVAAPKVLPLPTGELVQYRTAGGTALGYVDEAARWRRIGGENENETVVSWTALA
jgi:hypothetical protein